MKTVEVEKCMVPSCQHAGNYARGLCNTHYVTAAKMIQRKKITWKELEKRGKVKPSKKHQYLPNLKDYFLGDR